MIIVDLIQVISYVFVCVCKLMLLITIPRFTNRLKLLVIISRKNGAPMYNMNANNLFSSTNLHTHNAHIELF